MATLGTAYVQIVPSAQGISGKIQSAIDPEAKSAGTAAGKTISTTIGKGLQTVGGTLTKYVTKPVLAAGTALSGLTLAKGWSRMVEIDNARAKLTALGQDAKAVQESANAAVKGTAYSLNKAMTTAASAVAAGIEPGEKLTRYLQNIADASAVAGIDMDEMGAIFNKVATNGKMSAEELNQLSDRGIPAMKLLSEATGKSMDEVRAAISNGEIGIEELQSAIELGMDGAAKSIGSTTITGALSNLNAAIGRIGANILGSSDDATSVAGKILPLLNAIMKALEPVEEKAKTLGQTIAAHLGPAIDRITNMLTDGTNMTEHAMALADIARAKMIAIGTGVTAALGPVMLIVSKGIALWDKFGGSIAKLATKLGTTSGQLLKMGGIVGIAVAAFVTAYTKSETFRNAINELAKVIGSALISAFKALSPLLNVAMNLFVKLATAAGNILGPVLSAITPIIRKIMTVLTALIKVIASVATAVISMASKIVGVVSKVTGAFDRIRSGIAAKLDAAKAKVKGFIDKIKSFFPFKIGKIFSGLKLPKISVSGGKAPFGIAGKGSLPKFSVSWNARGAVFDQPTILPTVNGFQGVGEAGREIVTPEALMRQIVAEETMQQNALLLRILQTLEYIAETDKTIRWNNREVGRMVNEVL